MKCKLFLTQRVVRLICSLSPYLFIFAEDIAENVTEVSTRAPMIDNVTMTGQLCADFLAVEVFRIKGLQKTINKPTKYGESIF
jgi:hypothetical protein